MLLRIREMDYTLKRRKARQDASSAQMEEWMRDIVTEKHDKALLGVGTGRIGPLKWSLGSIPIQPWAGQKYKGWKMKGGKSIPCLRWFVARALMAPFGMSCTPDSDGKRAFVPMSSRTAPEVARTMDWSQRAISNDQLRALQMQSKSVREQVVRGIYAVADRDDEVCPKLRRILPALLRIWLPDEGPTPLRWEETESDESADGASESTCIDRGGLEAGNASSSAASSSAAAGSTKDRAKK